jgi:hemolysin-activating ACP:hemolysin acyltransferase
MTTESHPDVIRSTEKLNADLLVIMSLMAASPRHRIWTVQDVSVFLFPILVAGQYGIVRTPNSVTALTWAWLSDEAQDKYIQGKGEERLPPGEWTKGPNLWIMDLLSWSLDKKLYARELRKIFKMMPSHFGNRPAHFIRRKRPGVVLGINGGVTRHVA